MNMIDEEFILAYNHFMSAEQKLLLEVGDWYCSYSEHSQKSKAFCSDIKISLVSFTYRCIDLHSFSTENGAFK